MESTTSLSPGQLDRFAEAVAIANIPSLLLTLVQLSGESRWLEPPYRPARAGGMGDNDSGGLPEGVQEEIRAAALEAILAWKRCRQDVHDAYNERVDALHENMVWTHPGMETYYRNAHGRVVVNSRFRNAQLFEMTREADLGEFEMEPRAR